MLTVPATDTHHDGPPGWPWPPSTYAYANANGNGNPEWVEYLRKTYYLAGMLWAVGRAEQAIAALCEAAGYRGRGLVTSEGDRQGM